MNIYKISKYFICTSIYIPTHKDTIYFIHYQTSKTYFNFDNGISLCIDE